ncbi:MAG: toll/interleukin-1 receptor domain-containing protein [Candidatus Brocadiaceae bacterium]|nr:toll/interleukin-1 receptor domain-containing protein [Candidatus Brocadiaceae bacterium]
MSVWTPHYFRLFLSHVATYKVTAQQLKVALNFYNISCFVAHADIKPTKAWQDEIEEALRTMEAMAALLTPDFHESNWTDQEVGFAMGRDILVIPLRSEQNPYGFIGKYQGYAIRGKLVSEVAEDIVSILAAHQSTRLRMAQALVRRLEESSTWESSKKTMTLLEECVQFDQDLLDRMETTIEDNSQVHDAWGVPERIQTLITKFGEKKRAVKSTKRLRSKPQKGHQV